jgi:hypothetical protein
VEWPAARDAIKAAEQAHRDSSRPARILIINGSPRSEHTCPGEMSKALPFCQTLGGSRPVHRIPALTRRGAHAIFGEASTRQISR